VLIKEVGLTQERIIVAGLADSRPLESNDTPAGRSRNRRIEVIVRGK
jgi:chemotaxis protein MotB